MINDSIRKNAENEIDYKTKKFMQRNGADYRTALYRTLQDDPALAQKYSWGADATVVKSYDADTLSAPEREMAILLADTLKARTLAGWKIDELARRKLANVGGIADPLDAYRRALAEVRKENRSLAVAAESGYVDSKDFALLALLIPALQGAIQRGNFDREAQRSGLDVRIYRELPTASIKGLEIFATGTHNGDTYSASDLDAMVSAFNQVGFEPTVKAGHADGQESEREARRVFGAPALGYVARVYRQGNKLIADLKDIPRKFADLIKAGAYKRVSSEVYFNFRRGEKTYPRVLKAIAFLGASIPAITDLKAVENLYEHNVADATYADEDENDFRIY